MAAEGKAAVNCGLPCWPGQAAGACQQGEWLLSCRRAASGCAAALPALPCCQSWPRLPLPNTIHDRTCRLSSAVFSVRAGLHWSFRMSRQMAPLALEMLGCHTCSRRQWRRGWQLVRQQGQQRAVNHACQHLGYRHRSRYTREAAQHVTAAAGSSSHRRQARRTWNGSSHRS